MQKFSISEKNAKRVVLYGLLVALVFIKGVCVDRITFAEPPPEKVEANKPFTTKIVVRYKSDHDLGAVFEKRMVIGVLMPKSWNGTAPGRTTLTYSTSLGSGTMIRVPDTELVGNDEPQGTAAAPYPIKLKQVHFAGTNITDDHEWVAYWTPRTFKLVNDQIVDATVTITMTAGPENMLTKLSFLGLISGESVRSDDLMKKLHSSCVEVINGSGGDDIIDFCNKPLVTFSPMAGTDNDYFKINYDNDLIQSPVTGAAKLYVHIDTAKLTTGEVLSRRTSDSRSELKQGDLQKFTRIFWMRQLFGLKETQHLQYIRYYLVDEKNNRAGLKGSSTVPLTFRFKCD